MHLLAFVTFVGWIVVSGDVKLSLSTAISVLIITCPCALGLSVPAVVAATSGRLFRRELLVKDGTGLERLAAVDTVVFDKIGTLTQSHAQIDTELLSPDQVSVLSALCAGLEHPVSRLIVAAMPKCVVPANVTDICEIADAGVEGLWNGQVVRVGRGDWVGATASPALAISQTTAVSLTFAETLRDGAIDAVNKLRDAGYHVAVFTGDNWGPATTLAQKLGVTDVRADMGPEGKLAAIDASTTKGHRVLMVGDGLNDTAALAAAHASISPASALDVSRAVSDIVLVSLTLGIAGLLTFLWTLRNHQYEDLDGDAWRILVDDEIIPTPDTAAKAPLDKA